MEEVVLVDEHDHETGAMEKMEAHRLGLLHRAFSVIAFNSKNEILLHQRAIGKYHSGGLWTNACCSHPMPGERLESAASRKFFQEMGLKIGAAEFTRIGAFIYHINFHNGLIENEYDHVLKVLVEDDPTPNPDEVMDWKWVQKTELMKWLQQSPESFTFWFRLIAERGLLD